MVSSHYGGLGPGVLATILGGLLGFGFLPKWSYESVLNPHFGDLLRLGVFFSIGAFVSLLNRRLLSEKRRAEVSSRSYQESEERYRLLVEQVKEYAFYTIDPEGIVNTWNTGAERLKGYRAADIVGRSFALCFPPEEVERGKPEYILQAAIAHEQWVDEGWHVRKDGSLFWAEAVTTALRDERGRLRGFSQVIHDISDRKQAEEALRETNQTLQSIIQASPLAIMTFDRKGHIGMWSPAAERIFGWSEQEVMGRPAPMSQGSQQEEFQKNLKQAFQGTSLDGIEVQRPRKDGQFITVNGWSAPLQDADGVVRSIVAIMADVTERKRAEQALIEAYRRNTEILESISDAFYAVDHDGKFTYINRKAEQLWQKRREDLIGKNIWSEFPQAVGTESYEAHIQAVREQKTVSYETHSSVLNIWLRVNTGV
jgi:PAS domain S-box-containing protein